MTPFQSISLAMAMAVAMAMAMAMAMASSLALSAAPYFDFHSHSDSSSLVLYGVDCLDAQLNLMEYHPAMDEKALIEFNAYKDWILSKRIWKAEQVCVHDLDADKLSYLESLADTEGRASSEAKTLLMLNGRLDIEAEVVIPTPEQRSGMFSIDEEELLSGRLTLFPNPADEYVTVEYRIDKAFRGAEVRLIDVQGKLVLKRTIGQGQKNQILLPLKIEPGPYMIELVVDGKMYRSTQFLKK